MRTTDLSLFEEIIINAEYALEPSEPPSVIIDAGANIGLTSVFFANRFPTARIIAVEPEPANFELLKKNVAYYPNVTPLRAALWKEDGNVTLFDPGSGSWGFQTREQRDGESGTGSVPSMSIATLMARCSLQWIDLLKVDIEGAEKEVFERAEAWIERVGILMIELHDRDKAGCTASVRSATRNFDLAWSRGETTVLRHRRRPPLRDPHCESLRQTAQSVPRSRSRIVEAF
jgi:FkbM family methyltransferase